MRYCSPQSRKDERGTSCSPMNHLLLCMRAVRTGVKAQRNHAGDSNQTARSRDASRRLRWGYHSRYSDLPTDPEVLVIRPSLNPLRETEIDHAFHTSPSMSLPQCDAGPGIELWRGMSDHCDSLQGHPRPGFPIRFYSFVHSDQIPSNSYISSVCQATQTLTGLLVPSRGPAVVPHPGDLSQCRHFSFDVFISKVRHIYKEHYLSYAALLVAMIRIQLHLGVFSLPREVH